LNQKKSLWQGVLVNAFDDAATNSQESKPSIYKCDAHSWIMSNVTDFQQVCYYAGFEPDVVKERYKIAIMNKLISFSPKNFAWKKYSEQFTKYRNCKDPESKAYHRKHLEHLRNAVTSSYYCVYIKFGYININKKGQVKVSPTLAFSSN
jgi:hypothetical protein